MCKQETNSKKQVSSSSSFVDPTPVHAAFAPPTDRVLQKGTLVCGTSDASRDPGFSI
jgi:hypothetical protein